ncbi:hypothetical protein CerSpe_172080 [Prunus speciosa]
MELVEAQRGLENKELVEGGVKLEAEKDEGLNDCAPSLMRKTRVCVRFNYFSKYHPQHQGELVVDFLEVSSSMKGQEQRDHLLGRLFAYGALARSGRLAEEWVSDRNTPLIKEFTRLLIALASKKRYLQEPAGSVILDLIEKENSPDK